MTHRTQEAAGGGASSMTAAAAEVTPTDIEGFDAVLNGGLPRGRLHLLQGEIGAGKTTLALQFALAGARRGEATLYVSLAETQNEIRGIARSHGWSLDPISIWHYEQGADDQRAMQTVLPAAEFELPAAISAVLDKVESNRPTRLVIDSLSELQMLAGESRWYRRGLMRLRAGLEALGCTALLVDTNDTSQEAESYLGSVIRLDSKTPDYGPTRRRMQIIKMRGHDFATGYHDMRIKTGGIEVYRRLVAAEQRRHFEPRTLSTGMVQLDDMLGGSGLDVGTAVLFLGPTGTGKSTTALQCVSAAAARGERSLVYIFDERTQTVFQRAAGLGIPLAKYVDAGLVSVRQIDPAELTPGEFAEQVSREARGDGVGLVVLDSLNAYLYAMPSERFLTVHLHELLAHLSQQSVTSILIGAQRLLNDSKQAGRLDVSYLADTVLLFRTIRVGGEHAKTVTVHKRRAGNHQTGTREICFTHGGLSMGEIVTIGQMDVEGMALGISEGVRGLDDEA